MRDYKSKTAQEIINKTCKAIQETGLQDAVAVGFWKRNGLPLGEGEIFREDTVIGDTEHDPESVVTVVSSESITTGAEEGYDVAVSFDLSEDNECTIQQKCFKDVEYGYHEQVNW